jgi:hypothetical protein
MNNIHGGLPLSLSTSRFRLNFPSSVSRTPRPSRTYTRFPNGATCSVGIADPFLLTVPTHFLSLCIWIVDRCVAASAKCLPHYSPTICFWPRSCHDVALPVCGVSASKPPLATRGVSLSATQRDVLSSVFPQALSCPVFSQPQPLSKELKHN